MHLPCQNLRFSKLCANNRVVSRIFNCHTKLSSPTYLLLHSRRFASRSRFTLDPRLMTSQVPRKSRRDDGSNDSRVTRYGRTTWSHNASLLNAPQGGYNTMDFSICHRPICLTICICKLYSPTVLKILTCCLLDVALSAIIPPFGSILCARCSTISRTTRQLPQLINMKAISFRSLAAL